MATTFLTLSVTMQFISSCLLVLVLTFTVLSSDLGAGQQQTYIPELIQDEDVSHHWYNSHDFWSLPVILQLLVTFH